MKQFTISLFALVFFIFIFYAQSKDGKAKIEENCDRDADCINNAFCRSQMICQCEQYYSPTPDKTLCTATSGLGCNDNTVCQTMLNAECRQNVCTCKENFTLDIYNSSNCIPRPTKIGDPCQRRDECEEMFERAICLENKCHCITNYYFVNETRKCILRRGLFSSCLHSYECVMDDDTQNVLQCENDKCVCQQGDSRCSKGSFPTTTITSILLLLSLLYFI